MDFCQVLTNLLEHKGITAYKVFKDTGISQTALSKWKKGEQYPTADKLKILADYLAVSADFLLTGSEKDLSTALTNDEQELLTYYKQLDPIYKGKVIGKAEALAEVTVEKQEKSKNARIKKKESRTVPTKTIEYFDLPASAGTGVYLSDNYKEHLTIRRNAFTDQADFAVRISGDSMEPDFQDGDLVIVRCTPTLDIGDIGIFILNNEGYVKVFGGDRLISLNSNYDDILLRVCDDIRCKGRVISILSKDDIID